MLLTIHVKPNSSKDEIVLLTENTLKIKLKAPPVDGKANEYLIKLLSKTLKIPQSAIEITGGLTSKTKRIKIVTEKEFELIEKLKAL